MKPDRWWLLPLVLVSALVTMGASGDGCGDPGSGGDASGGGGNQEGQAAKPAAPTPDEPELTSGQEQALQAAESYVDLGGISKAGLIDQLSSSAGEGSRRLTRRTRRTT